MTLSAESGAAETRGSVRESALRPVLKANLEFSDLDAPARIVGGGVYLGSSTLIPVAHRMLRTQVTESDSFLAVVSCERFAGDPPGTAYRRVSEDRALLAEARAWRDYPLDWSSLVLDRKQRALHYRTSLLASVPIYAFADARRVAIDWDYSRLLEGLAVEIDWQAAMAHLAGTASYSPRSMVHGLYRSTAGATLTMRPGNIEVRLPEPSALPGPRRLAEGVVPERLFFETVKELIAARPMEPGRTAVEISGGMDSALVSIAAAEALGPGLFSTGAQFRGAMGSAQRQRRRLLCERGGFDDLELPADRFAPFSRRSRRRLRFGVWPQDETYPEIFEAIFSLLARAGIDTLISGFGGDELYPLYFGEEGGEAGPAGTPESGYLTPLGRKLAAEADEPYPQGPLQETSWQAAASRAQRLLRHGIWPVYPYHSPELAGFIAALPWEYRQDRRLLRRTLTARLGDPIFEEDYLKESFRTVAARGVIEHRTFLLDVVGRSRIPRVDLFDRASALADLEGDIAALPAARFNALFALLTTCCFFDEAAATQLSAE
jgi:asparagine synthase (glutamine-hydrolysing)